jgi:hypothetical protein
MYILKYCIVFHEHYFTQGRGGIIVNITATLPYRGQILQAHAGSAKAAIGGSSNKMIKCSLNIIPSLIAVTHYILVKMYATLYISIVIVED